MGVCPDARCDGAPGSHGSAEWDHLKSPVLKEKVL